MNLAHDRNQVFLRNVQDESFWSALHPDLHITRYPLLEIAPFSGIDASLIETSVCRIRKEGYFQMPPLISRKETDRLSGVIADLVNGNIPPVFGFVYDEFWQLFGGLSHFLTPVLGEDYKITPSDIWIFHLHKSVAATGWDPHRDMIATNTVRNDNTPTTLTLWIPLTDATPLNGCMYVLPTNLDPDIPVDMTRVSLSRELLRNIRAVPAPAGSVLGWNTRILHWGGRSSEWADHARISVAMYFQSRDINLNDLDDTEATRETSLIFDKRLELSFKNRVRAIAAAIQVYRQRVRIDYPDLFQDLVAFSTQTVHTEHDL
jgi:hypothetical protein